MIVLGISALYHDSAAALVKDGEVIAAAQEERFTRIKHDSSLPKRAIEFCLKSTGVSATDIDAVVFYDNPFLKLDRFSSNLICSYGDINDLLELSLEKILIKNIWVQKDIRDILGGVLGKTDSLFVTKHHIAHAASAFYPSPFKDAAILTIDGVGEWSTTSIGYGTGNSLQLIKEIRYPHSLGLLYSAFTYFCGFRVNYGDYKLMGLAPYGEPVYYDLIIDKLIDIKKDGSYRLNLEYFDYQYGRTMTNDRFANLFGGERRKPEQEITKREMDMAASVQKVVEDVLVKLAKEAKRIVGDKANSLVMAGGVTLNCVANGRLLKEGIFDNIWVQPAAGDAGGALGAALYYTYNEGNIKRECIDDIDRQKGSYLGPSFDNAEIEKCIKDNKAVSHFIDDEELFQVIAKLLDQKMVIGLFHGQMEFGPRALGNRSIIADPRDVEMQSKLNLKIKYRESFRPFAPSVLHERVQDYFELNSESPYMLFCADVKENLRMPFELKNEISNNSSDLVPVINMRRSTIPAVTHVDYSARIQTVSENTNPFFYKIIKAFEDLTGCGLVVNTSFNVRGEPIVCSPEDAYQCFINTEMDVLVMENYILYKKEQKVQKVDQKWRERYELD